MHLDPLGGLRRKPRPATARSAAFIGAGVAAVLVLSACSPAVASSSPSSAAGNAAALSAVRPGSVTGTVTTSDPADPIVASGVGVALYTGQLRAYSGVVDAAGAYSITGVAPGTYSVLFSGLNQFADEWYDDAATQDAGKTITVASSRATAHVDAELKATPVGQLGGVVTSRTGRDYALQPQSLVEVRAYGPAGDSVAVLTGTDGRYSFGALPAGSYKVQFVGRDSAPALVGQWSDSAADQGSAQAYAVTAGAPLTVDAELIAADTDTVRQFTTRGKVKIVGEAHVGSTISADPGTWVPTPTNYEYSWWRDGVQITGSSTDSRYTITSADAGHKLVLYFWAFDVREGGKNASSGLVNVETSVMRP